MSAGPRRIANVGSLSSVNPTIDSYIEKKRAMEERARQIKEERANMKPELDQAAQARQAQLARYRNPAAPEDYQFGSSSSSQSNSSSHQSSSSSPDYGYSSTRSASTSSLPTHQSNSYSSGAPSSVAAPPAAAAPTAGRSRQVFSAAPHGPASGGGGGGSVTLSRADYDALLERMQHMENEISSLRDKQTHFVEDFENTNADLISVRQEVKNLQRVVKSTKPAGATPTAASASSSSSNPKPSAAPVGRYGPNTFGGGDAGDASPDAGAFGGGGGGGGYSASHGGYGAQPPSSQPANRNAPVRSSSSMAMGAASASSAPPPASGSRASPQYGAMAPSSASAQYQQPQHQFQLQQQQQSNALRGGGSGGYGGGDYDGGAPSMGRVSSAGRQQQPPPHNMMGGASSSGMPNGNMGGVRAGNGSAGPVRNAPVAAAAGRTMMQPQQQQQQQQQYSASSYQQQQQQLSFDDQPLRSQKPSAQPPMYPPGGAHGQYGGAAAYGGGHAYGHGDDHDDQGDDDDDQGDEEEDDDEQPEQEDEMGGGDVDRMPCKVCGRKFVAASLARHMKVCEKVFVKKRKPMQVQRLSEEAQAELKELKRQNARNPRAKAASLLPPKDENAVPKWKIERAQLREALKAGREYTRAVAMGIDPPPMAAASAQADDRVLCPHCGRKFADMAAQRHIPKCATQRARPAPPPNRR